MTQEEEQSEIAKADEVDIEEATIRFWRTKQDKLVYVEIEMDTEYISMDIDTFKKLLVEGTRWLLSHKGI